MQQLKTILMTMALSAVGFVIFVIGLSVTLFVFFLLLIMSLFVKTKSHAQLKEEYKAKWQGHFKGQNAKGHKQHDIIEGQYDVVDN